MTLPSNASERKALPLTTGVLDYFPDALAAVAEVSKKGNDQHNPGEPLHWSKDKSTDHADCIVRHLIDRGTRDTDGGRHSAKVAWRALALLQIEIENERDGLGDTIRDLGGPTDDVPEPGYQTAGYVYQPNATVGGVSYHPDLTDLERVAQEHGAEVVHEADCSGCAALRSIGEPTPYAPRDAGPDFPAWH